MRSTRVYTLVATDPWTHGSFRNRRLPHYVNDHVQPQYPFDRMPVPVPPLILQFSFT